MSGSRPRAIIVSEIAQLLLLCELLWRAFQMHSIVSIVGAFGIDCIAGAMIFLATRKKKILARDMLAGLAILSWLLASGLALRDRELRIAVEGVLTINLIAVAMLYTDGADEWFGRKKNETAATKPNSETRNPGQLINWFRDEIIRWFNSVDVGIRPRDVFKGRDINLYPFTPRGQKWIEQNILKFSDPKWSQLERCLMLSDLDSSHFGLASVVSEMKHAGLKLEFYGRLKGWDGATPWLGD